MAENKRQYWVSEMGEYECPHYGLSDVKPPRYGEPVPVYMTPSEAKTYQDIAQLAEEAEDELRRMWEEGRGLV